MGAGEPVGHDHHPPGQRPRRSTLTRLTKRPHSSESVAVIPFSSRILLLMRLIVAEKPSVGRDIASALGKHRRGKGALVGSGWTVTWALGHLAELAPPDAYGEQYKQWRLETLPILPER